MKIFTYTFGLFVAIVATVSLIKADCCLAPKGHCSNVGIFQADALLNNNQFIPAGIKKSDGTVLKASGSGASMTCPTCNHLVTDHKCDKDGFPNTYDIKE